MSAESVQLAYQIAVQGRADLALAPDEVIGFSMTLLRLLAFEPAADGEASAPSARTPTGTPTPAPRIRGRDPGDERNVDAMHQPVATLPAAAALISTAERSPGAAAESSAVAASSGVANDDKAKLVLPESAADWPGFVAKLRLTGMAAQIAAQSELKSVRGNALSLAIPASHKHLADRTYADKLKVALEGATGRKLLLAFEIGDSSDGSPAAIARRERAQARAESEAAFRNEPFVRELVTRFDATVRPDTIEAVAREVAATKSPTQETP